MVRKLGTTLCVASVEMRKADFHALILRMLHARTMEFEIITWRPRINEQRQALSSEILQIPSRSRLTGKLEVTLNRHHQSYAVFEPVCR